MRYTELEPDEHRLHMQLNNAVCEYIEALIEDDRRKGDAEKKDFKMMFDIIFNLTRYTYAAVMDKEGKDIDKNVAVVKMFDKAANEVREELLSHIR